MRFDIREGDMKAPTAWAWAGPTTIAACLGLATLVRLRIAMNLSLGFGFFFVACLLLLSLTGAIYLARKTRSKGETAGFWMNILCVVFWTIAIWGLATFPVQQ